MTGVQTCALPIFQSDPSIEGGGCYIETELGNIDATLSTQVSELKKRFEESLQEL